MQADDDFADRDRNPPGRSDFRRDLFEHTERAGNSTARTAGILNVEMPFSGTRSGLTVERQLVHLAAESDH